MALYRSLFDLIVDAWHVVQLRSLRLASGGIGAMCEGALMWNEKIGAWLDEVAAIAGGETFAGAVARQHCYVATNVRRLTKS